MSDGGGADEEENQGLTDAAPPSSNPGAGYERGSPPKSLHRMVFESVRKGTRAFAVLAGMAVVVSLVLSINGLMTGKTSKTNAFGRGMQKEILTALSGYAVVITATIVIVEFECQCVMKRVPLMSWWTLRGFAQTFTALLTLHIAYAADVPQGKVFQEVSSFTLLATGCFYVILGLCGGVYTERRHHLQDLEAEREAEIAEVNMRWDEERQRTQSELDTV